MKAFNKILAVAIVALVTMGATECDGSSSRNDQTSKREDNQQRAIRAVPIPKVSNYLARAAVAKQTARMDETGKLFYVYLMAQNGNQIGYYVSNTRPVSVCAMLTPVDDISRDSQSGTAVTKAPGLGGTYGGGNCDSSFMFDAETDAYLEFPTALALISDQPLSIRSEPIRVVSK